MIPPLLNYQQRQDLKLDTLSSAATRVNLTWAKLFQPISKKYLPMFWGLKYANLIYVLMWIGVCVYVLTDFYLTLFRPE